MARRSSNEVSFDDNGLCVFGDGGPAELHVYDYMSSKCEIDGEIVSKINKALSLASYRGVSELHVKLHSEGGDLHAGFAIHDMFLEWQRGSAATTTCTVVGSAFSAAALITQAFDTRVMYPNAVMMLHAASLGLSGTTQTLHRWSVCYASMESEMFRIFRARLRDKYREDVTRMIAHDLPLSASTCVLYGLADSIVGAGEAVTI